MRKKEVIRDLLLAGKKQKEIIEATGASKSAISYHRKLLGLAKIAPEHNWKAIQVDMDRGMSARQASQKHGISIRAIWDGGRSGKLRRRDPPPPMTADELKKKNANAVMRFYERRRQWMIDLLGGKCVKCGSLENLETDHIDRSNKSFDIASNFGRKKEVLLQELAKCQLLCEKCHLDKTQNIDGFKVKHGSIGMYRTHKCRCDLCRSAVSAMQRRWRDKKRGQSSA